jgi:hypothetical protein
MQHLLNEFDVAERLNLSVATLRRWRLFQRGPKFVKVDSLVRYRPDDVEMWLAMPSTGGETVAMETIIEKV